MADQGLSEAGFGTAGPVEGLAGLIEPGSLLEATPECMVITAVDGRILFANRRLQELTGFDRGELIDHQVDVLLAEVCRTRPRTSSRRSAGAPAPTRSPSRSTWATSTVPTGSSSSRSGT